MRTTSPKSTPKPPVRLQVHRSKGSRCGREIAPRDPSPARRFVKPAGACAIGLRTPLLRARRRRKAAAHWWLLQRTRNPSTAGRKEDLEQALPFRLWSRALARPPPVPAVPLQPPEALTPLRAVFPAHRLQRSRSDLSKVSPNAEKSPSNAGVGIGSPDSCDSRACAPTTTVASNVKPIAHVAARVASVMCTGLVLLLPLRRTSCAPRPVVEYRSGAAYPNPNAFNGRRFRTLLTSQPTFLWKTTLSVA